MADSGSAYFRNLYDHLTRISDMVDAYRDLFLGLGSEITAIVILLLLFKRRGWLGSGPTA